MSIEFDIVKAEIRRINLAELKAESLGIKTDLRVDKHAVSHCVVKQKVKPYVLEKLSERNGTVFSFKVDDGKSVGQDTVESLHIEDEVKRFVKREAVAHVNAARVLSKSAVRLVERISVLSGICRKTVGVVYADIRRACLVV